MRGFINGISKPTYAPQTFVVLAKFSPVRLSTVELGNQFDDVGAVTQDGGQIVVVRLKSKPPYFVEETTEAHH